MIDLEEAKRKLDEYLNSEEGKTASGKFVAKMQLERLRADRVGEYLEGKDFDKVIDRIVEEHGDEWKDKCYEKGFEPHPNHKTQLLLDWISNNYESLSGPIPGIGCEFTSAVYFVKGYYFELICGQGCFWKIYDGEKKEIVYL